MLNEIRTALKQWHEDTKYITKIAPNDWGQRAHAYANKTVAELYIKIDAFEAEKAKELSDALAKLSAEKSVEITALRAELTLKTLEAVETVIPAVAPVIGNKPSELS